jgi:hypothetical protein
MLPIKKWACSDVSCLQGLPSRISYVSLIVADFRDILYLHLSLLIKNLACLSSAKQKMAKDGAIELQQPLGHADGASGASDVAKEEVSYHQGNEHDQADMARLGKKQRLDVRMT